MLLGTNDTTNQGLFEMFPRDCTSYREVKYHKVKISIVGSILLLGLLTTLVAADEPDSSSTLSAEELVILDSNGNRRIELRVDEFGPMLYLRNSNGDNLIDIGIETLKDGREEPRLRIFDRDQNIKVVVDRNSRYLFYGQEIPDGKQSPLPILALCFGVIVLSVSTIKLTNRIKVLEAKQNE